MTVSEFAAVMASDAPAPGGGSASALNGAIGAGLAAMVCALTKGRKKYAEYEELAVEAEKKAVALKDRFIKIIDTDTEAFNAVSAVWNMDSTIISGGTEESVFCFAEAITRCSRSVTTA